MRSPKIFGVIQRKWKLSIFCLTALMAFSELVTYIIETRAVNEVPNHQSSNLLISRMINEELQQLGVESAVVQATHVKKNLSHHFLDFQHHRQRSLFLVFESVAAAPLVNTGEYGEASDRRRVSATTKTPNGKQLWEIKQFAFRKFQLWPFTSLVMIAKETSHQTNASSESPDNVSPCLPEMADLTHAFSSCTRHSC